KIFLNWDSEIWVFFMYLFFIDISYLIGLENQSNLLLNHIKYTAENSENRSDCFENQFVAIL
ncbi:MAG: hypothetical protein LBB29_03695, partial [Holosporaceae bacterium]|nr:hypothetical protein [Holosporaceae bacterium]